MILNETNYLRQAIEKILFVLMVLIIIVLVIFFSAISVYFCSKEFERTLTKDEDKMIPTFSKSFFVKSVLENELLMFDNLESAVTKFDELENEFLKIEFQEIPKIEYIVPHEYDTESLENGKVEVGNTKISNYSGLELDLEELSKPLSMKLDSQTDFLIFHTHATESYTIDSLFVENYRSTNPEFNMISIGKLLVEQLEARGFSCLQDTILHDYPNYNGAYKHSLDTITKYLKTKEFKKYEFKK